MGVSIEFGEATKEDIEQLVELRIAYMLNDFGKISEEEKACLEKQLPEYFSKKLGTELIAFVARSGEKIVSVAFLHIIEMPANVMVLNGLCGEVLNVYTEQSYRGQGLCTQLMKQLITYGRSHDLVRIDLSATEAGFPIYKKVGFEKKEPRYMDMRYTY